MLKRHVKGVHGREHIDSGSTVDGFAERISGDAGPFVANLFGRAVVVAVGDDEFEDLRRLLGDDGGVPELVGYLIDDVGGLGAARGGGRRVGHLAGDEHDGAQAGHQERAGNHGDHQLEHRECSRPAMSAVGAVHGYGPWPDQFPATCAVRPPV